jgi:hypothetical protein
VRARRIITAIKSATRYKLAPLNSYASFSHTPAGRTPTACSATPCPARRSTTRPARDLDRGVQSLLDCLGSDLSGLESQVLTCYLERRSYGEIGGFLGCDAKDGGYALQRVKAQGARPPALAPHRDLTLQVRSSYVEPVRAPLPGLGAAGMISWDGRLGRTHGRWSGGARN